MARVSMKAAKAAVACELEEIRAAVRGEPESWSIYYPVFDRLSFQTRSWYARLDTPLFGASVKKGVKPKPKKKAPARRRK